MKETREQYLVRKKREAEERQIRREEWEQRCMEKIARLRAAIERKNEQIEKTNGFIKRLDEQIYRISSQTWGYSKRGYALRECFNDLSNKQRDAYSRAATLIHQKNEIEELLKRI